MKKIFFVAFILYLMCFTCIALGKSSNTKCKKPIYYFENTKMDTLFSHLDECLQNMNYQIRKYYPELGYLEVKYKANSKSPDYTSILIKQSGNDAYLFVDVPKMNTRLDKYIYNELKKFSKVSYPLTDDLFCQNLTKDTISIRDKKKLSMINSVYSNDIYVIDVKRYIGFKRKIRNSNNDVKKAKKELNTIKRNDIKTKKIQKLQEQGLGTRW